MEDRRQHRRFIKNKPQNLWQENFKKKCLEQFRRSRDTQVNQRRFGLNVICEEESLLQIIKDEWESFLLNEERFISDFDVDLAALTEEDLLQELKRESSICNSRSLEEEAEYALQFEPDEMYQDELEPQDDSDMIIIEEHSKVSSCVPQGDTYSGTILLNNIQNFECSKGLYDTSIRSNYSNYYQYKLFPTDDHLTYSNVQDVIYI